jgi:diguanylate cyclase (GGDEF)-like protein
MWNSRSFAAILRLAVLALFAASTVEAQCFASGAWISHWSWAPVVVLAAATGVLAWRAGNRRYFRWAKDFQAVLTGTRAQLDRERHSEKDRNRILELVLSNEPVGTVLDAILRAVRARCPDVSCAIVGECGEECQVMAALDVPREWLTALRTPHALPLEIWRTPLTDQHPSKDAAWNVFAKESGRLPPATICSRPIRTAEGQPGAVLLFYPERTGAGESDLRAAEMAERLAGQAIAQNRLRENLHFQAQHDSLTGLSSRADFRIRLDRSVREAELFKKSLAVLFIDLDQFRKINETFSHRVGDLLLREMANRIGKSLQPADVVARIGADEFAIVANGAESGEASEIAGHVLDAIQQPLCLEGYEIDVGAHIGIAVFPDDGGDAEKLLRAAEAAMYCAKDLGRSGVEKFSTRNEALDRVRMGEMLRVALREGYFVVHYQPKIGIDGKLAGFEALVRMNHPAHGTIPPLSFISVAESNGLIVPLGAWVLDEACHQIAAWESRGISPVSVAVNVSPVQICRSDFAKSVEDCLARHGVSASSLELELTESILIKATGEAQQQLRALRTLGVKLSIDDFGSGYSSLSYLHRLPVDSIKLDRSFVQSIDTDQLACRLVQAMIGVAQWLGLNVVAEGVETESQRDALAAAGCTLMQGFLFARPLPAAELEEFLRTCEKAGAPETAPRPGPDPGSLVRNLPSRQNAALLQNDLLQLASALHHGTAPKLGSAMDRSVPVPIVLAG